MQTSDGDLKAHKAKLANLEAALRAMPEDDEDFANERAAIAAKIAETKSPHTCETACKRSVGSFGAEALEMAQRVVEESDLEIVCIERELHDLEDALAHAPSVPAAIAVDNTVDAVSGQLQ